MKNKWEKNYDKGIALARIDFEMGYEFPAMTKQQIDNGFLAGYASEYRVAAEEKIQKAIKLVKARQILGKENENENE